MARFAKPGSEGCGGVQSFNVTRGAVEVAGRGERLSYDHHRIGKPFESLLHAFTLE